LEQLERQSKMHANHETKNKNNKNENNNARSNNARSIVLIKHNSTEETFIYQSLAFIPKLARIFSNDSTFKGFVITSAS
jgi:hypothetical protein